LPSLPEEWTFLEKRGVVLSTAIKNRVVAFAFLLALAGISCSIVDTDNDTINDGEVYADSSTDTIEVTAMANLATGVVPQDEGDPQEMLDTIRQRQELIRQKNTILVERSLENAAALKEQGLYEKAEIELAEALKIDPWNSEVLTALSEIQALLGKTPGAINEVKRRASERYEVKKKQLRYSVQTTFEDGKKFMDRGDYKRAILSFERVLNQIQWDTYNVDWGTLEVDAATMLAEAKTAEENRMTSLREEQAKKAFDIIRSEEEAQRLQTEERKNFLLHESIEALKDLDFDKAEELANSVIKIEPKNEMVVKILDDVEKGRRAFDEQDYLKRRREAWLEWEEVIERTRIPHFGILNEVDDETWAKISQMRGSIKSLGIEGTDDPENAELKLKLKSTRADFNFDEEELGTVASVITSFTAIPVVVDPEVKAELSDMGETVSLRDLNDITVESLLNIITQQVGEELTWTVNNGAVIITKKEKALGDAVIRIHPTQDISFGLTDFRGPVIGEITPVGEWGEDAETSVFGGELEKQNPIPPEEIENLIRENIAPGSWDLDQYSLAMSADQSSLLVIHTNEIQREVAGFLDDLRRFSSCVVTIESRFIEINKAFLQEIGADFRGLGGDGKAPEVPMDVTSGYEDNASGGWDNQGDGSEGGSPSAGIFYNDNSDGDIRFRSENWFGNPLGDLLSTIGGGAFQFSLLDDTMFNLVVRAVEKSYNATEITAPMLTVFNTQRSYITVVNQITYLQGFDVDVANSAFIANPNIGVIQDGIVLDVKPTVSYDRKYITLEIQATVADLFEPIREKETTLGGQTQPVKFQLPQLDVSTASTTVVVPDGGNIVLGGLKSIRYINRKAGTPILNKIPIVSFFFTQKGLDDEVRDLIFLAKAHISDMNTIRTREFASR